MSFVYEEELARDECLVLLKSTRVGRVGVSIDSLPAIIPVNFIALDGSLIFRCAGPSRLFRASCGAVLAFEADDYDFDGLFGWSVLVRGFAQEIVDNEELEIARSLWLDAWPLGERADRYIALPQTLVSGMKFLRVQ